MGMGNRNGRSGPAVIKYVNTRSVGLQTGADPPNLVGHSPPTEELKPLPGFIKPFPQKS